MNNPVVPRQPASAAPPALAPRRKSKQVAEELRAREAELRTIFDLAPIGIAHVGLDARWIRVNQRLCDILGYAQTELMAITFLDISHSDDQPEDAAQVQRLLAGEIASYTLVKRMHRKDGALVWLNLSVTLVRDEAGAPAYFIAVAEDITAQKKLEAGERAARAEAEARAQQWEATVMAMADGVYLYDATGHIVRMNPAGRTILGLDRDPQHAELAPDDRSSRYQLRDVHGQPLRADQQPVVRILRGEILSGPSVVEMVVDTLDGRTILLSFGGAPIRDAQGQITGAVGVCRDITERRQLEHRTHEALNALLTLAEDLVRAPMATEQETAQALVTIGERLADLIQRVFGCEMVCLSTLDPATGMMRPIAVRGLAPAAEEQWWREVPLTPLHAYIAPAALAQLYAGSPVDLDMQVEPLPNGKDYGIKRSMLVPMLLGDTIMGVMAVEYQHRPQPYSSEERLIMRAMGRLAALVLERDRLIHEREQARAGELAMQQTNAQMQTFLGIAGHELRTPVTALRLQLQMAVRNLTLMARAELPPEMATRMTRTQDLLATGERQIVRLNRLIEDVVDGTRIQTGKLTLQLAAADIGAIVCEAVENLRLAWPQRTIELIMAKEACAPLLVDSDRISQVVANIITNALKYSPPDASVEVTVGYQNEAIRVAVRDHGPGLTPEQQVQIWAPFHQLSEVPQQSGGGIGLGLGLHICRAIIGQHGGQIGVESLVGHGSTFWFTLPQQERIEELP